MVDITSTLSNAPLPFPVVSTGLVSSAAFGRPNPPHQQIRTPIQDMGGVALQYPNDRPKYYMLFEVYNYSRQNLNSVGELSPAPGQSMVVLPLPQQLNDVHQVAWNDHVNLLQETLGIIGPLRQLGQVATPVLHAGQSLLGVSPNQFMTILLEGPKFKRFSFVWTFSPNDFREADILRQIVRSFNNWMSPTRAGPVGSIWAFPKIFWISIMPNSKFMLKFKPAVLESFLINPTPGGKAAFYHNQPGGSDAEGNNPPQGLSIEMRFLELEHWTEGNFTDSNNPKDVYNLTPSDNPNATIGGLLNTATRTGQQLIDEITNALIPPAN